VLFRESYVTGDISYDSRYPSEVYDSTGRIEHKRVGDADDSMRVDTEPKKGFLGSVIDTLTCKKCRKSNDTNRSSVIIGKNPSESQPTLKNGRPDTLNGNGHIQSDKLDIEAPVNQKPNSGQFDDQVISYDSPNPEPQNDQPEQFAKHVSLPDEQKFKSEVYNDDFDGGHDTEELKIKREIEESKISDKKNVGYSLSVSQPPVHNPEGVQKSHPQLESVEEFDITKKAHIHEPRNSLAHHHPTKSFNEIEDSNAER